MMTRDMLESDLESLIITAKHGSHEVAKIRAKDILDSMFPPPMPTFYINANNVLVGSYDPNLLLPYIRVKSMPFLVSEFLAGNIPKADPSIKSCDEF